MGREARILTWFVLSGLNPAARRWARRFFKRGSRRIPAAVCGGMAVLFGIYLASWSPSAFGNWLMRSGIREAERRALNTGLTYGQVALDAEKYAGSLVRWHLVKRGNNEWFYRGDPLKPIVWAGNAPDVHSSKGHAIIVVAGISGRKDRAVRLSYQGSVSGL